MKVVKGSPVISYQDVYTTIKQLGCCTADDIKAHIDSMVESEKGASRERICERMLYLQQRGDIRTMKRKHMIPHQGTVRGAWIKHVEVNND